MSIRTLVLLALYCCATAANAAKPPKPVKAPAIIKICEECHGLNGIGANPSIPHLNGQLAENTSEALKQFKEGKRPSSTPQHANPEITEKDITILGKYYFAQIATRPEQATDAAKAAAGEPIYKRRCTKCHIDNGRDADHEAPLLAGQSLPYLQAQTEAFVSGKRSFPFLMDESYKGLSAEDLDRLSHFFASQKQ